jgi:hypothetical protein
MIGYIIVFSPHNVCFSSCIAENIRFIFDIGLYVYVKLFLFLRHDCRYKSEVVLEVHRDVSCVVSMLGIST